MVIKLYISGISGNKEVKKKQQRVQMILDSKQISYEAIDITEPGKEKDKEFMQQNGKVRESLGKYPLPPQIFNDEDFCGDYEDFDLANEVDELEKFLHIATNSKDLDNDSKDQGSNHSVDGQCHSDENSPKKLPYDPYEYHEYKIKWVNGLQEEIITTNISEGEINQTEGVTKSEVNGETDAAPSSEPPTDDTGDTNPEVTSEVSNPAKEGEQESSGNENPQESTAEDVEDNQKNEGQAEGEDSKLDEGGEEEATGNAEEKSPQVKEEEEEEEEEGEKKEEEKEEEEKEEEEEEEAKEEEEEEESKENLDNENKKESESEKEEESENEESEEKSQED